MTGNHDIQSARERRRQRRGGAGLLARGEPAIWITGGALALSLVMVVCLLALIVWQGIGTFWPMPLQQVSTIDGARLMGEQTRAEEYALDRDALASMKTRRPKAHAAMAARFTSDAQHTTPAARRLLRTGNFELTNEHFDWIDEFEIETVEFPEWVLTIERRKNGRFYGELLAYVVVSDWDDLSPDARKAARSVLVERAKGFGHARLEAGKVADDDDVEFAITESHDGAEAAWTQFLARHADATRIHEDRRHLEKVVIGALNHRKESARVAVLTAQLNHGVDSEPYRAAVEARRVADREVAQETIVVQQQIAELEAQTTTHGLLVRTAAGIEKFIPIGNVVRAYTPNRLSFADKLSIYLSRWGEFLADEPREANSEGGVLPAIFGTVMMTMVMCIVVVPFGVLAALYLREYAKAGVVVSAVRIAVNNLAGVPSIVFGVFGLGFFSYTIGKYVDGGPRVGLGYDQWSPGVWLTGLAGLVVLIGLAIGANLYVWSRKRSLTLSTRNWILRLGTLLWLCGGALLLVLLIRTPFFDGLFRAKLEIDSQPTYGTGGLLWASLTLALLTLPVVIVATEEALAAVPNSMREGSYACGASKWQTIRRIVLPRAMPGIMTGTILAMARGAGEVAPLMLVGAVKLAPDLPIDGIFPYVHPERSFMHLGFHIYDVGFQSQNSEAAKPMVYTTTLLLIGLIASLNLAAIWLRARLRRRFKGSQF